MSGLYNKKIRKITIPLTSFLMVLSFIFSGCGQIIGLKDGIVSRFDSSKQEDEAVSAVKGFFEDLIEEDLDSAYKYIYIPQEPGAQDPAKTQKDFEKEFENITKIESFEINWVEVKNNIATVGVDLIDTYDGEEKIYKDLVVSLVKDSNEEWKINFWNQ